MDILEDESFDENVVVATIIITFFGATPTIAIVAWTCAFENDLLLSTFLLSL
jgi:hypothetical protein